MPSRFARAYLHPVVSEGFGLSLDGSPYVLSAIKNMPTPYSAQLCTFSCSTKTASKSPILAVSLGGKPAWSGSDGTGASGAPRRDDDSTSREEDALRDRPGLGHAPAAYI